METELRAIEFDDAEFRCETCDGKTKLIGYAAVYDRRSKDLGGMVEVIRPGAFDSILATNPDVMARYDHRELLGRTSSGTLRLQSTSKGLLYELDLPETRSDIAELIRRGDIRGSSFAFRADKSGQTWTTENGVKLRSIHSFSALLDVGPVANPAYSDTSVALRSFDEAVGTANIGSNQWLKLRLKYY